MSTIEEKLSVALRKDREGRGLKNSEIGLLRNFRGGKMDDEGSPTKPARLSEGDSRSGMKVGRDTLWQEEGEPGPAVPGGGYVEGAASDVVGSDGKLLKAVRHSTYAAPSTYPTLLRTGETGSPYTAIGPGGFETVDPAGNFATIDQLSGLQAIINGATIKLDEDGITSAGSGLDFKHNPVFGEGGWYVGGTSVTVDGAGVFRITNGTQTLTINPALITANMSLREIDVCDGGVAKKMLIVASAPY